MDTKTCSAPPAIDLPPPPDGAAEDWTVPQRWERFSEDEHAVWDRLFARQQDMLHGRAVEAFHQGMDILQLDRPGIPRLDALNERLRARTGWTIVAVPGRVPDAVWHAHLSQRRYPAGNFIRRPDQLDYIAEPDVFHDMFGHVPLLALPEWADFMQRIGGLGLEALALGAMHRLARLYWYTVEFGLCREREGLRIYGAGIVSSFEESRLSLESAAPHRLAFDLERVLRTRFTPGRLQRSYFVIEDFWDLLDIVSKADLPALYAALEDKEDFEPNEVTREDRLAA